jgi:aminomethyltransferase
MDFMTSRLLNYKDDKIRVSRCGYTGEDGFEVSVPEKYAHVLAEALENKKDQSGSTIA